MEGRTWIDDLVSARVLMFMLLFAFVYLGVVLFFYPFLFHSTFRAVTEREIGAYRALIGHGPVKASILVWGDGLYDGLFVNTGAERMVYGWVSDAYHQDAPIAPSAFPMMADSLFDYLLTVSYRLCFFVMLWVYFGIFVACTIVHALIGRVRARYTFGDTPIFANIYARGIAVTSLASAFMVLFWPGFVHPLVLAGFLTFMAAGVVLFWASLPKSS